MRLARIIWLAMLVAHEKTLAQDKVGGLDVLMVVMEYSWSGINDEQNWVRNQLKCFDKVFNFNFGPVDQQARFSMACSSVFGDPKTTLGYDKMNEKTFAYYLGLKYNQLCFRPNGVSNLQSVLEVGQTKIVQEDKRKDASLVTIVFSDSELTGTTLSGAADFFIRDNNIVLIVYRLSALKLPPSENNTKRLAGGRNEARVIYFTDNPFISCEDNDFSTRQLALCSPKSYNDVDVLSASPCRGDLPNNCTQIVTFKPEILRAETICEKITTQRTRSCPCPAPTTTGATTAKNVTVVETTAAKSTLSPVKSAVVVGVVGGILGLLVIGAAIFVVCKVFGGRKKRKRFAETPAPEGFAAAAASSSKPEASESPTSAKISAAKSSIARKKTVASSAAKSPAPPQKKKKKAPPESTISPTSAAKSPISPRKKKKPPAESTISPSSAAAKSKVAAKSPISPKKRKKAPESTIARSLAKESTVAVSISLKKKRKAPAESTIAQSSAAKLKTREKSPIAPKKRKNAPESTTSEEKSKPVHSTRLSKMFTRSPKKKAAKPAKPAAKPAARSKVKSVISTAAPRRKIKKPPTTESGTEQSEVTQPIVPKKRKR